MVRVYFYLYQYTFSLYLFVVKGSFKGIHEHSIIRALTSNYKPNRNLKSIPSHTIFIRISPKTTEETLRKHFSPLSKIISCVVIRDIVTGISKGYGFIELDSDEAIKTVTKTMNKTFIDNFKIIVEKEFGRNLKGWKPRRLGGGFGGNRNSGQLRFGGTARPFEEPNKAFRITSDDFKESASKNK